MKRFVVRFGISAIGIYVLVLPDVFNSLVTFILLGIVPGTTLRLPFWAMIMIVGTIGLLLLSRLSRQHMLIGEIKQPASTQLHASTPVRSKQKSKAKNPKSTRTIFKRLHRKRYQPAH